MLIDTRIVGIVIGLMIMFYAIYKRWRGSYRRLDLIIALSFGSGITLLSVSPATADVLADLFGLRNRLFATLVFSNVLIFSLFLYVLNKSNSTQRQLNSLIRAIASAEHRKTFPIEKEGPSIFIVIPAYNEEKAIAGVLREMPKEILGYDVYPIVVVDGSSDKTEEVVRRENYMVATHVMNQGQGSALRTGFEIALREGTDIVMTMDADGQHKVEDIPRLVKPIIDNEADYVMGSRFLGEYEDSGGWRHKGIIFFTYLINLLSRLHITDCTNGFRAIRGRSLAQLELREDKFNAPELIMEAARKGLRIKEVPVIIKSRTAGTSKKPPRLGYPLGFLRTIVQTWLR